MVFKAPKQRIDAYLGTKEYIYFIQFCEKNYCKNATAGLKLLIENQQNYENIIKRMRAVQEKQNIENLKNAEVIKNEKSKKD